MEYNNVILLDCDTGSDDGVALAMLLNRHNKDVKAVGITCVEGNTRINHVTMNNLRILKLHGLIDEIPVFKGATIPLVPITKPDEISYVFGKDGLGDQPDFYPEASPELLKHLKEEHAVQAIIRLSKEHAGKLKIVATGPLTNLALAVRCDPDLPKRLKSIYIMGGTRYGKGNETSASEFNFSFDPEAAYITLSEFHKHCPTHLINFEYTLDYPLLWNWYDEWLKDKSNKIAAFIKMSCAPLVKLLKNVFKAEGISICDAYTMAVALDPKAGLEPVDVHLNVELSGFISRGAVVINHFPLKRNDVFGPVIMYNSFDFDLYKQMLINCIR